MAKKLLQKIGDNNYYLTLMKIFPKTKKTRRTMGEFKCKCGKLKTLPISRVFQKRGIYSCGCYITEILTHRNKHILSYSDDTGNSNAVFMSYQNNAKNRNREFNLSKIKFLKLCKQNCFYCNQIPRTIFNNGNKIYPFVYNGIDRINNDLGYISENVVSCCRTCNFAKGKLSQNTFKEFIKFIFEFQNFGISKKFIYFDKNKTYDEILLNIVVTDYFKRKTGLHACYLSKNEILNLIKLNCHYCGINPSNIQFPNPRSRQTRFVLYNGIDRKNPTLGYTLDNCVPACKNCNFLKNTSSYDDFIAWVIRVYEHQHRLT